MRVDQATIETLMAGGGEPGMGDAIKLAARKIKCEVATLQAILNVESGGDAYDDKGRLIILPEKHIFWRYLPKSMRNGARASRLATPKWSKSNYKGLGGKGSDKRWDRLKAMVTLHGEAGFKSASYGKAQIMGFNHKLCGFSVVTEFVLSLAASEDNQDDAFIGFLLGVGLAEDLRQRDFRAIARRYNGSGQVDLYSGMIAREYKNLTGKAARIKSKVRQQSLRLGSEGYMVEALQKKLNSLGYATGIDGDFGPATRRALVAFQADIGLKTDGIAGRKTNDALEKAVPIMQQGNDGRQDASIKDLKKRSSIARKADTMKKAAGGTGFFALFTEYMGGFENLIGQLGSFDTVFSQLGQLREVFNPALKLAAAHPWLIAAVVAALVFYQSDGILKRRLFDFKNWRNVG